MKYILSFLALLLLSCSHVISQWTKLTTETNTSFFSSFFLNSQTGWVGGQETSGKIFSTTNSGINWTLIYNTPSDERFESLFFLNNQTGWAGSYYSRVYKTTDGGQNWSISYINNVGRIWNIYFIDANTGWITSELGCWKTTSGGNYWQYSILNIKCYGLYFFNNTTGLVSTTQNFLNTVKRTTNGGGSWTEVYSASNNIPVYDFDFINNSTGFASGFRSLLLKTTNNGLNWADIYIDTSTTLINSFKKVKFIDNNLGYVCGQLIIPGPTTSFRAIIKKTTDGGITWQNPTMIPNIPNIECFEDMMIVDGQTGYVVGGGGTIYKSTNAGYIGIQQISSEIPERFSLSQNYPNPFNPVTRIKFQVPLVGAQYIEPLQLKIFDILGREIKTIINEQLKPGTYEVEFDGTDLPSGVYFYRLKITDASSPLSIRFTESKKMVLVK